MFLLTPNIRRLMSQMMIEKYYIDKSQHLEKPLGRYLGQMRGPLVLRYGQFKADAIVQNAKGYYPEIIPMIPFYSTPMYDQLILVCSRMMALKKAMKDEGLDVVEFVGFNLTTMEARLKRIPLFIRKLLGGWFFIWPVRWYLGHVARSATNNGWPTEVVVATRKYAFDLSVLTRDCGMLRFIDSVGEGDLRPYCTFFDFAAAEAFGIGLVHESSIDSGTCAYAISRDGRIIWPDAIVEAMGKYISN